jgi:hypothetical protein
MAHEHDIDGEYLTSSDVAIRSVEGHGENLSITAVLPCPECDDVVEITFSKASEATETDFDFPFDDGEAGI